MKKRYIFYLDVSTVKLLDELVKMKKYRTRSEALGVAIGMLLKAEHPKFAGKQS